MVIMESAATRSFLIARSTISRMRAVAHHRALRNALDASDDGT
jgi:hypothetical protein